VTGWPNAKLAAVRAVLMCDIPAAPLAPMCTLRSAALALLMVVTSGCAVVVAAILDRPPAEPAATHEREEVLQQSVNQPSSSAVVPAGAPIVLYADLVSGPNTGGEDNDGAYLSIFGKNFGAAGLGSSVRVYVGGVEVTRYLYLGVSRGRPDIQQIAVQIGSLGNPSPGTPLPIKVVVDGSVSNTDQTFSINPGRILYVDNVRGNDSTAVIGDINHPFRHVQTPNLDQGAWGRVRPGDIIVMRGTGTPWTDVGFQKYFIRYRNKSGSAPAGRAGTGAIALLGYPTEDVYIDGTLAQGMTAGCIAAVNGQAFPGMGQWAVISNLRISCEGWDGPINQEIEGNYWRVINNDLSAPTAPTSGASAPKMAAVTGNGVGSVWLGNRLHDIQGSSGECHGVYIDGNGSYEIAYNLIDHIRSGNGLQTYANGTNGSGAVDNVYVHHNLIHDVAKHGINISDGSRNNFVVYDNVIYNVAFAAVRFNTVDLKDALIYHNTFYNTNTSGDGLYAVLTNDWNLPAHALFFANNILRPARNTRYLGGSVGLASFPGTITHNLFYGGADRPSGSDALEADPQFVDAAGYDFHLETASPAIGAGTPAVPRAATTDYDVSARDPRRIDVGAFAYPSVTAASTATTR
jgi:hypothetical protein